MDIRHSPEPWSVVIQGKPGAREILVDNGEDLVAMVAIEHCRRQVLYDDGVANARRIVAAVNACAGISTEDLERLVAPARNGHAA